MLPTIYLLPFVGKQTARTQSPEDTIFKMFYVCLLYQLILQQLFVKLFSVFLLQSL